MPKDLELGGSVPWGDKVEATLRHLLKAERLRLKAMPIPTGLADYHQHRALMAENTQLTQEWNKRR